MPTTVAPTPHVRWWGRAIAIAGLVAIGIATLIPEPGRPPGQHFCLVCGSFGGVDAFLNVLLFVPLGIGLAMAGISRSRAIAMMLGLSALIEIAQLLVIPGRDSTVGDVINNTLGGALGFALARHLWVLLKPSRRIAAILTLCSGAAWLAIQAMSNYGFVPSLPESRYYGQLARAIGNFALFEGRVLSASAGGVQIPNHAIPDSRAVRRALNAGAPVEATVDRVRATGRIAPIVRVADSEQREIVLLAQLGSDLVYSMRSGAAVLRLRRPLFALPRAFASAGSSPLSADDTLGLSAGYLANEVTIGARTPLSTRRTTIPLAASRAWTLILPFDWLIEGTRTESLVGWIWTACLLIPFGYWLTRLTSSSRSEGRVRVWAPLSAFPLLAIGFGLIPRIFAATPAPPADIFAAVGGILLGFSLALAMGKQ
jgi:glycopeptide antibiotics resistance protein